MYLNLHAHIWNPNRKLICFYSGDVGNLDVRKTMNFYVDFQFFNIGGLNKVYLKCENDATQNGMFVTRSFLDLGIGIYF